MQGVYGGKLDRTTGIQSLGKSLRETIGDLSSGLAKVKFPAMINFHTPLSQLTFLLAF